MVFGWRACYAFLLALCACVAFAMFRWLPETRPVQTEKRRMLASFRQLLGDSTFSCYLVMLIGAGGDCGIRGQLRRVDGRRVGAERPDRQHPVHSADPAAFSAHGTPGATARPSTP